MVAGSRRLGTTACSAPARARPGAACSGNACVARAPGAPYEGEASLAPEGCQGRRQSFVLRVGERERRVTSSIVVEGATKRFPNGVEVFDGLDLVVRAGECL